MTKGNNLPSILKPPNEGSFEKKYDEEINTIIEEMIVNYPYVEGSPSAKERLVLEEKLMKLITSWNSLWLK